MSYKRKTFDEYDIQGDYGQGFETVHTTETFKDARRSLREHRANVRGVAFRIKKTRVPITADGKE
jgi:hypothetical protein